MHRTGMLAHVTDVIAVLSVRYCSFTLSINYGQVWLAKAAKETHACVGRHMFLIHNFLFRFCGSCVICRGSFSPNPRVILLFLCIYMCLHWDMCKSFLAQSCTLPFWVKIQSQIYYCIMLYYKFIIVNYITVICITYLQLFSIGSLYYLYVHLIFWHCQWLL
jgi:hypothetical protein